MSDDPKMDFRYTLGDIEIEGYQITPASRWQQQLWPDWLRTQRLTDDTNCVFSMADNPDRLWLSLPSGDVELPPLAWVVRYSEGKLGYIEALEMENYVKVVPLPLPVVHPPADAVAPVLAVVPAVENVVGDITEMRNEMLSAIKLLQEVGEDGGDDLSGKALEALDYLKARMAARTKWCNCPPGQCEQPDDLDGCREKSPLL